MFCFFAGITSLLSSCGVGEMNRTWSYLNFNYRLVRLGDIGTASPFSEEVLDRVPGYVSYTSLFSTKESYINFQCKGTSYEDFYCEASFRLVDKNDCVIIQENSFRCKYTGGQTGYIIYDDEEVENKLGNIYVYTPYWCRWQFEYDVNNDGNKQMLTFEFWKMEFNELPGFLNNYE